MQGNNGQQGNQGGQQKSGGLSWTQSPSQTPPPVAPANTAKPISQVSTPPVQAKAATIPNGNRNMSSNNNNHSPEKNAGGAKFLWPFLAGVIVGLIIGWGWFSLRTDNDSTNTATSTPTSTQATNTNTGGNTVGTTPNETPTTGSQPTTVSGSGELTVSTQDAGLQVAVSSISVSQPTWVVIFDNNNGTPGNALGAAMFFPGDKVGSVELLRATVSGKTYLAGEYVDDGDHLFSKQKDMQVSSMTGSPMLTQFNVR